MNKFLRYSFVALMAMIGLNISAQEVTLDFTLETSEGSKESVWGFPVSSKNKTVDEQSFTYGGYTVKVAGSTGEGYYWHDKDHYLLFGKQGAYLTLPAFDFDVERIDIEGNSGASAGTKQNIFVGEEAVSTETVGAQGTNYFTIADGKQAAGTIYTIKVTSNHNNQIKTIKIWKKGAGTKQAAEISWSSSSASVTINANDNVFPTLNNPNNLTVSYTSSKEDVATIDASGSITLKSAGSTKISAVFEGNDSYEASTVSYNLTVKDAEGGGGGGEATVTDATVAQALAVIEGLADGAKTDGEYKVTGYVVEVTDISVDYGNATFTIADAKGGSPVLTVFRAKDANGDDIKNANFVKVDDLVVVQGKLQKYVKENQSTPEIAQGGKVLTINGETATGGDPGPGPDPQPLVGDGSKENPFTVAQAFAYLDGGAATDDVYVKGKVSKVVYAFDASHKTGTFWISEDGTFNNDLTKDFEAYSVYWLGNKEWVDGMGQVAVGDEVVLCGKITKYTDKNKGTTTYETSSKKAYVYSINGKTE